MLKTLCTVATVALLAGGAFAQSNTAPSSQSQNAPAASQPAESAPAATDNSAANSGSTDEAKPAKMHRHHRHMHEHASRGRGATDWDADKLNACQPDANPTPQQLDCMRQVERARS